MILASLARYYRRLAAETDDMGNPKVPSYGFSEEKISWILVLDKEGRLKTVVPNLTADKKPQPKLMSVPRPEKRTSGIKPNFLWDKTAYALGVEANKNKAEVWGSDNICIERNKKIWREKMRWSPCLWGFVVFKG